VFTEGSLLGFGEFDRVTMKGFAVLPKLRNDHSVDIGANTTIRLPGITEEVTRTKPSVVFWSPEPECCNDLFRDFSRFGERLVPGPDQSRPATM